MPPTSHTDIVQQEFQSQAAIWAGPVPAHLQALVANLNLKSTDTVLDVAAGSCRVSRAMAPWVKQVTAVELTEAMLNQGRAMAQQEKLTNITFKLGPAENLDLPDNHFDLTINRYSFHHFLDHEQVLKEMVRVTKRGGRVIVIDILSPADAALASEYNRYERLRDPSHTNAPLLEDLKTWYDKHYLDIVECHTEENAQGLEGWLNIPSLAETIKAQIRSAVQAELADGPPTGLRPFIAEDQLNFRVSVVRIIGQKR